MPTDSQIWAMRNDPATWGVHVTRGWWKPYPHLCQLAEKFRQLASDDHPCNRLLVTMPPQHGKSAFVSTIAPSWYKGRYPNRNVATISYGVDLARKFSRTGRSYIKQDGRQVFGVELDPEHRQAEEWGIQTTRGQPLLGEWRAAGIEGGITGHRIDLLSIDDPFKNYKEALSPGVRSQVWDEYQATCRTRLSKHGRIIITQTRWHPEDLIGMVQLFKGETGENWEHLHFPAIAEQDEYFGGRLQRRVGDALCPGLHSLEWLLEQKASLGPYKWNALYQGNPTQPEGTFWSPHLFDGVYVDEMPGQQPVWSVICIDPSLGSDQAKGDYTAIVRVNTYGNGLFYVDAHMSRATPRQTQDNLVEFLQTSPWAPDAIGIESIAFQTLFKNTTMDFLRANSIGTPIIPIDMAMRYKTEKVRKEWRIQTLDPIVTERLLRFRDCGACRLGVSQMKAVPHKQEHDDFPDALEMCFSLFMELGAVVV